MQSLSVHSNNFQRIILAAPHSSTPMLPTAHSCGMKVYLILTLISALVLQHVASTPLLRLLSRNSHRKLQIRLEFCWTWLYSTQRNVECAYVAAFAITINPEIIHDLCPFPSRDSSWETSKDDSTTMNVVSPDGMQRRSLK